MQPQDSTRPTNGGASRRATAFILILLALVALGAVIWRGRALSQPLDVGVICGPGQGMTADGA